MKRLVDGLVGMSSLRDRDALDQALVQLVGEHSDAEMEAVRLVRIVGEAIDLRCLTLATWGGESVVREQDMVWADWSLLPHLADFPNRLATVVQRVVTCSDAAPFTAVFPIEQTPGVANLIVEVTSPKPLSVSTLATVESAVENYRNLLGLLDYGEKDALTELLNRKSFDGAFFKAADTEHLELDEIEPERRAVPRDAGHWLAVLDIDHFKRVNDNFGHLIGDEVLLLMARLMRSNFRFHDQLYRFGGEEFVILMRCPNAHDAHVALERLRSRVESHTFPQVGHITVSIGYTCLQKNDTPGGAFGRADKAVYYAKEHGRNQICSHEALVQSGALEQPKSESMDVDLF
jgi:diguanylate cyclase (GGDEF)-like protein